MFSKVASVPGGEPASFLTFSFLGLGFGLDGLGLELGLEKCAMVDFLGRVVIATVLRNESQLSKCETPGHTRASRKKVRSLVVKG